MIWIPFLVCEFIGLSCQGDENPHRDDRAHHAEEYGGSGLGPCDAILQSKHDNDRHGRNGRREHRLANNGTAIAEPSQTT